MFKNTFGIPNSKKTQSFYISKDTTTNYVNGVIFRGKKNAILERILASINKYLANNRANVIDFMKDRFVAFWIHNKPRAQTSEGNDYKN